MLGSDSCPPYTFTVLFTPHILFQVYEDAVDLFREVSSLLSHIHPKIWPFQRKRNNIDTLTALTCCGHFRLVLGIFTALDGTATLSLPSIHIQYIYLFIIHHLTFYKLYHPSLLSHSVEQIIFHSPLFAYSWSMRCQLHCRRNGFYF